jgi:hypothetical protein
VPFKCRGVARKSGFTHSPHQVKPTTRSVVFIASDDVGGTGFETEAAMNACKKLVFFLRERGSELC